MDNFNIWSGSFGEQKFLARNICRSGTRCNIFWYSTSSVSFIMWNICHKYFHVRIRSWVKLTSMLHTLPGPQNKINVTDKHIYIYIYIYIYISFRLTSSYDIANRNRLGHTHTHYVSCWRGAVRYKRVALSDGSCKYKRITSVDIFSLQLS